MADYGELLKRPFTDIKKLVIGVLLSILPIVNFFAVGFAARAGKLAINGKKGLPEFDNWGDLFVKGLLITVIGLIWMIPAGIIFMIFGGMALIGGLGTSSVPGLGAIAAAGVGIIAAVVVLIVTIYILGAVILNYIAKDAFGAAFEFGEIFKKAFTGPYFIAWITAIVLSMVLGAILGFVPFIGPAFAGFVSTMWWMLLLGNAYRELK